MILYPTETLYALGVNALDEAELKRLFDVKERDEHQTVSWLVRNMEDVEKYAVVPPKAAKIAEAFLPGKLTLVLLAKETVPLHRSAPDRTVGIRISSDPFAQEVVAKFMEEHNAPLTCTSANISGLSTLGTVGEILQQFGAHASSVTNIVDGGPRKGLASTVVRIIGDEVTVLREGDITESDIRAVV